MFNKFILVVIVILFTSQTFAFDGKRNGFVLGIGFGYVPLRDVSSTHYDNPLVFAENHTFGYGISNKDIISYDVFLNLLIEKDKDLASIHGTNGICWSHYFKEEFKTFYNKIGLVGLNEPNESLLLEFGYSFKSHWQTSFSFRKNINGDKFRQLTFLLTVLAY